MRAQTLLFLLVDRVRGKLDCRSYRGRGEGNPKRLVVAGKPRLFKPFEFLDLTGFRPHLGNRCAISTFPPPRRLLDCFLNSTPERSFPRPPAQASFRLILVLEKTPGQPR